MNKAEIIAMAVECGAELFEQQNGNDANRKYNVYIITPDEIEELATRIAAQAIAEHIAKQIAPAIGALTRYEPELFQQFRMESWLDGDYIKYSDVVEALAAIAAGGAPSNPTKESK